MTELVRYVPQTMDGIRTEEQQSLLLARVAYKVWQEWCRRDGNGKLVGIQGQDPKLDEAVRFMYQQLNENDVFYSGIAGGRNSTRPAHLLSSSRG